MGDIRTKAVIKGLIGALLGLLICLILYWFGAYGEEVLTNRTWVVIQFLGSGLNGLICMGGTFVYDIESWSLRRATLTHATLTIVSFLTANYTLGWFDNSVMAIAMACFVLGYLLIWLFEYALWKREISRINRDLEQMLQKEKDAEGKNG